MEFNSDSKGQDEIIKTSESTKKDKQIQSVTKFALFMSMGTFFSRILGLIRDILLGALFPAMVRDAFVVAFRLPNMFRRLLGEGALSVSFIPVFVGELAQNNEEGAKKLSHIIFTLLMVVASSLSVLGVIFIRPLISVLISGEAYQAIPGKLEMTIQLSRIMFSYLFLVTTYAYFMSLLNALKRFFLPALAPALFNLIFIFFAFFAQSKNLENVHWLAWGVIFGGVGQLVMTLIPLWRLGYLPKIVKIELSPLVRKVFLNFIPGLIGLGILQLMSLVNVNLASQLKQGAHSYIYFADRILELPNSLIAVSLSVALLPTLSQHWALNDIKKMHQLIFKQVKNLLFLALPCSVGMYFLALPIVEVLFKRGQFSHHDSLMTASILKEYAFLLISVSLVRIFATSFHATKNTTIPAVSSVLTLLFHIVMAPILMRQYELQGLVASTVLSGYLNLIILNIFYRKKIGVFPWGRLVKETAIYMLPLSVMGLFLKYFPYYINEFIKGDYSPFLSKLLILMFSIGVGGFVYLFLSHIFKLEEARQFTDVIKKKFKNKKV